MAKKVPSQKAPVTRVKARRAKGEEWFKWTTRVHLARAHIEAQIAATPDDPNNAHRLAWIRKREELLVRVGADPSTALQGWHWFALASFSRDDRIAAAIEFAVDGDDELLEAQFLELGAREDSESIRNQVELVRSGADGTRQGSRAAAEKLVALRLNIAVTTLREIAARVQRADRNQETPQAEKPTPKLA